MKVYAFLGRKGAGKSTLARALSCAIPESFVHPLAAPLKAAMFVLFPELQDKSDIHSLSGLSYREIIQRLGTEFGRDMIHEDVWLERWHTAVRRSSVVIVDDVRFANEVAYLDAHFDTTFVWVEGGDDSDAHSSESLACPSDVPTIIVPRMKDLEARKTLLLDRLGAGAGR